MDGRDGRTGNAFACERCRKHKVKCVASDVAGICQRCQKARVECIEHIARRRPVKPRAVVQPPDNVADSEKSSIENLHSINISATGAREASATSQSSLPPVATIPSQSVEPSRRTSMPTPVALPLPVSNGPILPHPGFTPDSALSFWKSLNDAVSGLALNPVVGSISIHQMESLLKIYRTMTDFFPFVLPPQAYFGGDLIQQRPIFLFAILTVASFGSVRIQASLAREFRKVVMVKVLNGEKSLDLLQGLLTFIAWHHHYVDAHATSVHLLLQICIGIVGELGLEKISSTAQSPVQADDAWTREAKRAYLGCYYLASTLGSLEGARPRMTSPARTVRAFAKDIAHAREHPSDSILPFLIDACQFMEDVEATFGSGSAYALVARVQLKRLNAEWERMHAATMAQAEEFRTLRWIQLAARIYLNKCLAALEIYDTDSMPSMSGFHLTQRGVYLRCLKLLLDDSLQLSSGEHQLLSITDWLAMLASLTTLARFSLNTSPLQEWDPVDLQVPQSFEYYRDHLSNHMPQIHDPTDHGEDLFQRFRRVTASMKSAVKTRSGGHSPNGSTFELATGFGRTVSLLQELPPLKPNGTDNNSDPLPTPWRNSQQVDINSEEFLWKFLVGSV